MQRPMFPRVKEGDRPSAEQWNQLVSTVEMLAGMTMINGSMLEGPNGVMFSPHQEAAVQVVESETDIFNYAKNSDAADLWHNDVTAGNDPWVKRGSDVNYITDTINTVILNGERFAVFRDASAGKNVIIPGVRWHLARLDGSLSPGGNTTASVWEVAASGLQDSGRVVTVYDWLLTTGNAIAMGKNVIIIQHQQSERWYVVASQC